MKDTLKDLITQVLDNRYVNIYGLSLCGKTKICFELCKYFYMNNLFEEGIYYINLKKINTIKNKEELKDLINKNKINNDRINNVLLIFDNFDSVKKDAFFSYINKLKVHCIIVTTTKLSKIQGEKGEKINEAIIYKNLDDRIDKEFAEELINYLKIINNASQIEIDEKKFDQGDIYVKELIKKLFKKLKIRIEENKKEEKENTIQINQSN